MGPLGSPVLVSVPMTAALVSTVFMTFVLVALSGETKTYGELWFTGWWVSAACLYAFVAYLTGVYYSAKRRERRKWAWLEEL